ncbi:penicillin-binding protein [Granulicella sp. 5B5]|uniref:transglycosylase domain-containing protein n=1 Tax=Granulicella sp. 5B5 TaxID=1617967 RepID=UPI0015F6C1BC|nr:transglycosylase domain-containing protein [Granulicella sp. 5B5]QMV17830.1 penicillin-binding protein [Granulicella sp. 5B5]
MPVKVKFASTTNSLLSKVARVLLAIVLACLVLGGMVFGYFYFKYRGEVDKRLAEGPLFASIAQVYAAPQEVRPGQELSAISIAASLRHAGYNGPQGLGNYQLRSEGNQDSILIKPGPESYLAMDGATIVTTTGPDGHPVVKSIIAENGAPLAAYKLEPQLITAMSEDKNRTKRRLVTYDQIPPRMVQAVLAIEDRRFFEHSGLNYGRTLKCAVVDLLSHHMSCGGSTLTQQLARGFFLSPDKRISRKIAEIMITFQLEHRFNKRQIFEMYANEIPLGQRGSFAVNGFGEAAQAYFGKDLRQLDLAECAMLAGIIQRPSYFNPYKHPDRVMERRNIVIDSMVETQAITTADAEKAKAEPIRLAPPNIDASEAPYFVDLVHDEIVQRLGDSEAAHAALRIYTSLDPELQRAAADAVAAGMKNVDELVRRRYFNLHHKKGEKFNKDDRFSGEPINYPQVALVALNPHTGQVLALIGGRNYAVSQLNHAVSERPTGSIFKPFVYATAYNTSLEGTNIDGNGPFTALTKLNDDPQDFGTPGKPYEPGNFERGEYPGMVTAATAIEHSLNIATIALAQMVGYNNVASLARSAGIVNAKGTPSVAIGTYSATPIDMAGAYTVFANNGVHLRPWILASVRNPNGDIVADFTPEAKQVLDPRVAYLTQSMLEGVMARGTGSAARAHGFTAPAAGKTGTSHDAWFAGYSSNLLCIIWVGNDDYTDVKLQGADAAAPIWAEFMNRAIKLPQYSDMKPFTPPDGVEVLRVNTPTGLIADDSCPDNDVNTAFLIGTTPSGTCSHMGESSQSFGQRLFNIFKGGSDNPPNVSPTTQPQVQPKTPGQPQTQQQTQPTQQQPAEEPTKHRNLLEKMFGVGKPKPTPQPQDQQPQ